MPNLLLAFAAFFFVFASPAAAQTTCSGHRDACLKACTGVYAGCTNICADAHAGCMKTGTWSGRQHRINGLKKQ